ncbi:HEAT repeat domain-containing protein [candidate division KSB1 bacterium]|nr:HEAT repeat domain-containing protein [candidate division KSB1 bacterium]
MNKKQIDFTPSCGFMRWLIVVCIFSIFSALPAQSNILDVRFPMLNQALEGVAQYSSGPDRSALAVVDSVVVQVLDVPALKEQLEVRILQTLEGDILPAGLQFLTQKLGVVGSKKSLPLLDRLLRDDVTFDPALYALSMNPDHEVTQLLLNVFPKAGSDQKMAIVHELGFRRDKTALKALHKLLKDENPDLVLAVVRAVGRSGDVQNLKSLSNIEVSDNNPLLVAVQEAELQCAGLKNGKLATSIRETIYKSGTNTSLKSAALRSMVLAQPDESEQTLLDCINHGDPALCSHALAMIREIREIRQIEQFIALFSGLDEIHQIQFVTAFADRKETGIRPLVHQLLDPKDETLCLHALAVLPEIADLSSLNYVLPLLENRGAIGRSAAGTLNILSGRDFDRELVARLPQSDDRMKALILESLGSRSAVNMSESVMQYTQHPDLRVRIEAIQAMGQLGSETTIPDLMQLLIQSDDRREQNALQMAVVTLAKKDNQQSITETYFLPLLTDNQSMEIRISLLKMMGQIGEGAAMPVLLSSCQNDDNQIQKAAIEALANWPDAQPLKDLHTLSQSDADVETQRLALQSMAILVGNLASLSDEEKIAHYRVILQTTQDVDFAKWVLNKISSLNDGAALDVLVEYLDRSDYYPEIEQYILQFTQPNWWRARETSWKVMPRLAEESKDANIRKQAEIMLLRMDE